MADNQNAQNSSLPSTEKKSLKNIQIPNWAAIVIIVSLLAVIGLVYWFLSGRPSSTSALAQTTQIADEASPDALKVEVLPQTVRNFDGGEVKNPFANETLGDIKLTGIISNSNGKSTAIIKTQTASYVVSEGDTMLESSWVVSRIGTNSITFSNGGSEKTVYMDGKK